MVVSRNVGAKKRKNSTNVVRVTMKQDAKLKSNVQTKKLGKKARQTLNVNLAAAKKATLRMKSEKLKENLKTIDKDLTTDAKEKFRKPASAKLQNDAEKPPRAAPKKRVGNSSDAVKNPENSEPQTEQTQGKPSKKRSHRIQIRIKKRIRAEEEAKNAQTVTRKPRVQIKKTPSADDPETTDTLDLKDLSRSHILQCITAIFHLTQEQLKSRNELFDGESHPVFLQVTCIRVPKTPRRCMRIELPHSIVSPDDDVALFVCDLRRGRRNDYEPTIDHYRELLAKHGCTRVNSIIPMNQVKTEYDQFELKKKLFSSYDHFLVDGRVAGHMSHLLGNEFERKRKLPTSVRMQSKDLKHEIEYALRKTTMQLHSNGDTHVAQIGHTSMKEREILENILKACSYLSKNYPGGWTNVRSIRIKTATSMALPIYTSLRSKNSVEVPIIKATRPKAYRTVKGELSTLPGDVTVKVTPEGQIIVKKKKTKEEITEGSDS